MIKAEVERRHHLPATKILIGLGLKGRIKPLEEYIHRCTVLNKVRPLFVRGGTTEEISFVTGFTHREVNNAIDRKVARTKLHRVDESFFTPEKIRERSSRSRTGKTKFLVDRLPLTQEKKNSIDFTKSAQEKGFFTDDLTYWVKLNDLYQTFGRKLPESFYDRFRLEALLSAIEQAKKSETTLLSNYAQIGRNIDHEWLKLLAEEEGFIKAKLLTYWADGEDEKGFFKLSESGGKIRQVEREGEGYVNMNSQLTLERLVKKAIQDKVKNTSKREIKKIKA